MLISPKNLVANGRSFASFGELVQGRLTSGEDFLATLPVNLFSEVTIYAYKNNDRKKNTINCSYSKTKRLLQLLFNNYIDKKYFNVKVKIKRNIPIGKGLASSTADQLAAITAFENMFRISFTKKEISCILTKIEPHDALHYNDCVVYNHRKGKLIKNLKYVPSFKILVIDFGGIVDTIEYNKNLNFSNSLKIEYNKLLTELIKAFKEKNDILIARIASKAANLYLKKKNRLSKYRKLISTLITTSGALGYVITHSGTCLGLLYHKDKPNNEIFSLAKYYFKVPYLHKRLHKFMLLKTIS